jgi:hypothetical protein
MVVIAATTLHAQGQPAAVRSDTGVQKILKRVPPPDQGSGFHFTKHLAVVFGGIKPGQGIAAGPAVSTRFNDGGYAQLKGVYSVRNFRLVQGRYDTRSFWHRRAIFVTRGRWQDAPELSLYRLGADSPRARAQYGERETELSTALETRLTRLLHVSAGAGLERYAISTGTVDPGEDHALAGVPLEPGLSTRPWFSRTFVGVALDSRATGYARSGTVLDAALGDYRDQHDGTYSFQHAEGGIRQFVAIGSRGSVGVTGRIWISHADVGHAVPFFLIQTTGRGRARGVRALSLPRARRSLGQSGIPPRGPRDDRRRRLLRSGDGCAGRGNPGDRSRGARRRRGRDRAHARRTDPALRRCARRRGIRRDDLVYRGWALAVARRAVGAARHAPRDE